MSDPGQLRKCTRISLELQQYLPQPELPKLTFFWDTLYIYQSTIKKMAANRVTLVWWVSLPHGRIVRSLWCSALLPLIFNVCRGQYINHYGRINVNINYFALSILSGGGFLSINFLINHALFSVFNNVDTEPAPWLLSISAINQSSFKYEVILSRVQVDMVKSSPPTDTETEAPAQK